MAIEIAINNIPRMAKSGRIIKDGTAASIGGVFRMGRTSNGLLASCCNPIIQQWFNTPIQYAAAGVHPIDQADGGRWWGKVTPPWLEAYCIVLAATSPGTNAGTIVFTSRSGTSTCAVSAAAYGFIAGAAVLPVSSVGVEEIYATATPGAGETVFWKAVSIFCGTRSSL